MHPGPADCLDDDAIGAYVDGAIDARERRAIDAHLDACGACRALVTALARRDPTPAEVAPTEVAEAPSPKLLRRSGDVLAQKWRLERLLGAGGVAAVYEATHVRNGKRVAVKVLHPWLATKESLRARFLREGYAANKVGHEGAVSVLDDDIDGDLVFLVLDLLDGVTVARAWSRAKTPTPSAALRVADAVLAVLEAAHAAGVVHRDVKPENLFLLRDGSVKVLDFGVARLRENDGAAATRSGVAIGTPAFMAPEQARGDAAAVGPRTDLWSLGATLFTLLSGRYVHDARGTDEVLFLAGSRPAPALALAVKNAHPEVSALVDRALAFEPEKRFENAVAMRAAVRSAFRAITGEGLASGPSAELGDLVATTESEADDEPRAEPKPRASAATTVPERSPSRALVALAAVGGVAIAIVAYGRDRPPAAPIVATAATAVSSVATATSSPASAAIETASPSVSSSPPSKVVKPARSAVKDVAPPPASTTVTAAPPPRASTDWRDER